MENENLYREDEISLKELIEIIWRGKILIASITGIIVVLAAIASFVIMEPQYEASTTILISPIETGAKSIDGMGNIIDTLGQYPMLTAHAYKEQIKTPQVLEKTIRNLQLKDNEGKYIGINQLANSIDVKLIDKTNMIRVSVTSNSNEEATRIVNELCNNFIDFVNENIRRKGEQSAKFVKARLIEEEEELTRKTNRYVEYLSTSDNLNEMKNERDIIISNMTSFKNRLISIEASITADLITLKSLLESHNIKDLVISDKITMIINERNELEQEIPIDIKDTNALKDSLITIEIAELEIRTLNNLARRETYEETLVTLADRLLELQTTIAEEEHEYNVIQRDITLTREAYNAYQQKYKETLIAVATDIGNASIFIASEAMVPEEPIGPNKKLNIAIAFVLGGLISVGIVFFRAYWESAK